MRGGLNIWGACARAYGRRGRVWEGSPPPSSGGSRGITPEKLFETETSVGAFLRTQMAIL